MTVFTINKFRQTSKKYKYNQIVNKNIYEY